ncbi:MAG: transcription elongation factor GreB [Deltaproteobacteria bacterium]|nr:transcription elongation factor GreB [Deltaproteobacteria bacterium]
MQRRPPATHPASKAKPSDEADESQAAAKEEKNYITPAGYRRLTEELDYLRFKKRSEVVSALSDAAAEGDRSENAEYIYRKKQLREIDKRIRFLAKRIDVAVVTDPREQKQTERVFFGATVTVEDGNGEQATYRIVGVDEIDGVNHAISWRSPVGRALLGKRLDDTVTVALNAGARELTIVEISYAIPATQDSSPPAYLSPERKLLPNR